MNPYVLEYLLVQMYPPQEEVHIPVQVVLVVVGQVLAPLLVLVLIIVPAEVVLVVHLHILLLQEDPVRHIIEVVLLLHHVLIRGKALVVTIIVTVLLHLSSSRLVISDKVCSIYLRQNAETYSGDLPSSISFLERFSTPLRQQSQPLRVGFTLIFSVFLRASCSS